MRINLRSPYDATFHKEELNLVNKGIAFELNEFKKSKTKAKTLQELKKKYQLGFTKNVFKPVNDYF